jgi:WD40 repeat protein
LFHSYIKKEPKDKGGLEIAKKVLYTGSADTTVKGWDPEVCLFPVCLINPPRVVTHCMSSTLVTKAQVWLEFSFSYFSAVTCMFAKNSNVYSMSYDVLYTGSVDGTIRAIDIEVQRPIKIF